jgi:glycosyltransferase involved in cell wall biosynthesis
VHKCRAVISSGRFHHAALKRLTHQPLEVLYPGCFATESLPPFANRNRAIVTYDRWDNGNRPTVFLELLERLAVPDVSLIIGGFWHPPGLQREFLSEVERRGMAGRVQLLGPLNEQRIMELCSTSMVHVNLIHEAFGMPTLEAGACGCVGVMAEGSGVAEVFEDGVSGIQVPPNDVATAAARLREFFNDPVLAARMSEEAWRAASAHTWDAYACALKSIVEKYKD